MAKKTERTRISAIVHTRNSAATVERTLQSLTWVEELLVVDMESTDRTLEIAQSFADRILQSAVVPRVDGIRDRYILEAASEWVLALDSDEYLAQDAEHELRELIESHGERFDAFALPRFNYVGSQMMRGIRWYPDHQIRLFRKGRVSWNDTTHEHPIVIGGPQKLMGLRPPDCLHIHHQNYRDVREFLEKQLDYALRDSYPDSPEDFDFSKYVARAYEQLALRTDEDKDGDFSHAIALIMAWDQITRGLIHWESLHPRPPLGYLKALPVATGRVPWWRVRLNRFLAKRHSLPFLASRPAEILRWWRWKRRNRQA